MFTRLAGKDEGNEEIVMKLLEKGMADSLVAEVIGFSEKKIRQLRSSINE